MLCVKVTLTPFCLLELPTFAACMVTINDCIGRNILCYAADNDDNAIRVYPQFIIDDTKKSIEIQEDDRVRLFCPDGYFLLKKHQSYAGHPFIVAQKLRYDSLQAKGLVAKFIPYDFEKFVFCLILDKCSVDEVLSKGSIQCDTSLLPHVDKGIYIHCNDEIAGPFLYEIIDKNSISISGEPSNKGIISRYKSNKKLKCKRVYTGCYGCVELIPHANLICRVPTLKYRYEKSTNDANIVLSKEAEFLEGLQTKKKQLENEIHVLEQTKAEKEKEANEVADKLKSVIQAHMAQLQTKIEEYKTVAGGFAMRVDQKLFSHIQSLVSSVNNAEDIQSCGAADNVEDVAEYEHTEDKSLPLVQFRADLQNSSLGNEIIRRVVGYMAAKKRHCSVVEVTNYLICMTQGFMTTFAGNPGSGKTSLCNLLASALGLVAEHDGKHFVDVPVCRGWTSAKDFIGYYNPLAKQMVYSNAAVYKALDLSQKEDSSTAPPMVILLDEANLSPLEHYWSSFLKNSDFSSSATRTFSLGGENVWTISPHLRFLATVNHDHTTEELSPRFLDRSWVILLDGQSSEVDNSDINIPDISGEWAAIPYAKLEEAFGAMTHEGVLMNPEVKTLWDNICSVMQSFQMRIMPRNVNMVENYVKTASLYMSDTFAPLDYAIAQKILPTLSGSGERMKDCLIQLRHLCDGKLPRTKALLVRMLEAGKQNMEMYQFFIS